MELTHFRKGPKEEPNSICLEPGAAILKPARHGAQHESPKAGPAILADKPHLALLKRVVASLPSSLWRTLASSCVNAEDSYINMLLKPYVQTRK